MHYVAPAKSFHFVNKIDHIRDVTFSPGEGLVVDEACLSARDVDDAKALCYLKKNSDVGCRNADGYIPRGTPRVFSTNWPWEQFWPHEAFNQVHAGAIRRRVAWVRVKTDVRRRDKNKVPSHPVCLPAADEDEDPFGHGSTLE